MKNIESKDAFKSLLEIKNETLIEKKQEFNSISFELTKAYQRNQNAMVLLQRAETDLNVTKN